MEEQILKILREYQSSEFNKPIAKEITSHVMEFIEWMDSVENPFSKTFPITKPVQYVNFFEGSKKKYILADIYSFWLTNIHNK